MSARIAKSRIQPRSPASCVTRFGKRKRPPEFVPAAFFVLPDLDHTGVNMIPIEEYFRTPLLFQFQGNNILDQSERSPLLARRGGCAEGADGVVDQVQREDPQFTDKKMFKQMRVHSLLDPPPRRSAPPLLARRGDGSDWSITLSFALQSVNYINAHHTQGFRSCLRSAPMLTRHFS